MEGREENYSYTECGLSNVVLMDVVVFHCACGAIVPEIPAVEGLHYALALALLRKDSLLSGEEIRFLRKIAGYSATELAQIMGVTKFCFSRWENDKKNLGSESDRLLRFACFFGVIQRQNPEHGQGLDRAFNFVKEMKSMNLPDWLKKIEKGSGRARPEPIRINPETLVQYRCGPDRSALEPHGGSLIQ